ncbi:MAG: hypothetical protein WCW13_00145 [archaeon]
MKWSCVIRWVGFGYIFLSILALILSILVNGTGNAAMLNTIGLFLTILGIAIALEIFAYQLGIDETRKKQSKQKFKRKRLTK